MQCNLKTINVTVHVYSRMNKEISCASVNSVHHLGHRALSNINERITMYCREYEHPPDSDAWEMKNSRTLMYVVLFLSNTTVTPSVWSPIDRYVGHSWSTRTRIMCMLAIPAVYCQLLSCTETSKLTSRKYLCFLECIMRWCSTTLGTKVTHQRKHS